MSLLAVLDRLSEVSTFDKPLESARTAVSKVLRPGASRTCCTAPGWGTPCTRSSRWSGGHLAVRRHPGPAAAHAGPRRPR